MKGYNNKTGLPVRLGIKHSEKAKQRIRKARANQIIIHSELARKNMGEAKKGKKRKPFSGECKKNMGKAHIGNENGFKKGQPSWNKGLPPEKQSGWKGGISFEPYSVDWTDDLKRAIRKRDKYTCQICGEEPAVCVHHIDYNKKNCSPDNLITLCRSCHTKTNSNRNCWTKYFQKYGKQKI